jgi:hypothetical protein
MGASISGKERIQAALAGERTDRVPFAPNIWQWFYVHQYNQTLPTDLRQFQDPVDVLKAMGAEVLSKFDGNVHSIAYPNCEHIVSFEKEPARGQAPWASFTTFDHGLIRRDRVETPFGTLSHVWEYREDTGAPFESKHWFEDFETEHAAVRFLLQNTEYTLDRDLLRANLNKIGDDGVILLQLLPSPLKQFHWLAGQERASLFIFDHPREMRELACIWEQKAMGWLEEVVDLNDVVIFEVPDNLDSLFYPPYWYREFCLPILQRQAEMIHARGKYLFQHACGHLKALGPLIVEAGLDCVEGQAPPPLGDLYLHEARALSDSLIVCGGMAAPEQELTGPETPARIECYVRDLFSAMGDKRRFLFASSCSTSPQTPYQNLLSFRNAAWQFGQL